MSKLNNTEKYIVKGMLSDKIAVVDIAKKLGKTKTIVQNYIDTELDQVCANVVKGRMDASKAEYEDDDTKGSTTTSLTIYKATSDRLLEAGVTQQDATNLIKAVETLSKKNNVVYTTVDECFTACIMRMRAGNFMLKKTVGGREGIAIMTGAASGRTDASKKKAPTTRSRSSKGHIYRPKTGDIE